MAGYNWNKILNSLPEAHLLQSAQWSEVKGQFGWQPFYLVWQGHGSDLELIVSRDGDLKIKNPAAAALVLERKDISLANNFFQNETIGDRLPLAHNPAVNAGHSGRGVFCIVMGGNGQRRQGAADICWQVGEGGQLWFGRDAAFLDVVQPLLYDFDVGVILSIVQPLFFAGGIIWNNYG